MSNFLRMNNTIKVFDENAQVYQDKFIDETKYNSSYDAFINELKPKASVLELACGPGLITRYISTHRPDLEIIATDLSEKMLDLASINSPTSQFQILDAKEFASIKKNFEGIICGFGLPYFSKEETLRFIKEASNHLINGGLLYFSLMEDLYENSGWRKSKDGKHELFIYYHEYEYLVKSLLENDFEVIYEERLDIPDETSKDLLLVAKKF